MTDHPEQSRLNPSFWLALMFFIVIVAGVIAAADWRWDTRLFPWAVGVPASMLALWQVVADFRGRRAGTDQDRETSTEVLDVPVDRSIPQGVMRQRTLSALAWIAGFAVALWLIGFLPAIPLFVFFYLKMEARAGGLIAFALAAGIFLFIWAVFDLLMNLAWPAPALFTLFR